MELVRAEAESVATGQVRSPPSPCQKMPRFLWSNSALSWRRSFFVPRYELFDSVTSQSEGGEKIDTAFEKRWRGKGFMASAAFPAVPFFGDSAFSFRLPCG